MHECMLCYLLSNGLVGSTFGQARSSDSRGWMGMPNGNGTGEEGVLSALCLRTLLDTPCRLGMATHTCDCIGAGINQQQLQQILTVAAVVAPMMQNPGSQVATPSVNPQPPPQAMNQQNAGKRRRRFSCSC